MKTIRRRKSVALPDSRWLAYATAGIATSLVGARSAEATIHYSGMINRLFSGRQSASFQLDQPADFIRLTHQLQFNSFGYGGTALFGIVGQAGASFAGFYNTCAGFPRVASVSNLDRGQLISSRPFVPGQSGLLAGAGYSDCNGGYGQFDGQGIGFIGFKFNNGSGDQYGWARIQTRREFKHNFKLLDYAYGDVGDRIGAGQKSSNEMVTDKGSLGWLALGAVGLLAWRKSRSKIAAM